MNFNDLLSLADGFPEIRGLIGTYGEDHVTAHQYVNGGTAITIRGLHRPDLGQAVRYVNGAAETTITIH